MQILKHGVFTQRKFTCKICECEFVADPDEYTVVRANNKIFWYSSTCPECGAISTTSEAYESTVSQDIIEA